MRYVVRLVTMTLLLVLVFYGLDFLFPVGERFPTGLSLFAVAFMLASVPGPGELATLTATVAMRVVAPVMGIALALWILVGVTDLGGPLHSDSALTVGGICLALELLERGWKLRKLRRDAADRRGDDGGHR